MTLNYGGEQHLVLFNFKCQSVSTIDADKHEIDDTRYAHFKKITCHVGLQSKVECNQGKPQVNYKEAITKEVNLREVYKKQSGGRGK